MSSSSGDDFFVYMLMVAAGLIGAIALTIYAVKAVAASWWVHAGGLGIGIGGPFLYDWYVLSNVPTMAAGQLIKGKLEKNQIVFSIRNKAIKRYQIEGKIVGIVALVGALIAGVWYLASHHFPYAWLAVLSYIAILIGAYRLSNVWDIQNWRVRRFQEAVLSRMSNKGVNLDIERATQAIDALDQTAQKLGVQLIHSYKQRLDDLIAQHIAELIETEGDLSDSFTRKFDKLSAGAEADSRHITAAADTLKKTNAYYKQVMRDLRRARDRDLLTRLQNFYEPTSAWGRLSPLVAQMQWKQLEKVLGKIMAGLEEIHKAIPGQKQHKQQRSSSGSKRTSNNAKSSGTSAFDWAYKDLDLQPNASINDIKKAYRRLSKIHHPDKETGDEAMFKKIDEAYQTLKKHRSIK